jgi:hypothetical protein
VAQFSGGLIMVILREATIKYKGYDPEDLKPKSNKKVCCSCDICGKISYKFKSMYRNLCQTYTLEYDKEYYNNSINIWEMI